MDNLNNRKVEVTIECKCVGFDEALEKVSKLVQLLKQAEEYEERLAVMHSSNI